MAANPQRTISLQFIEAILPEWMNLRAYGALRASILDSPKATIARSKKHVVGYAIFCATAPYLLAILAVSIVNLTHILPKTSLEREYQSLKESEDTNAVAISNMRSICGQIDTRDAEGGRICLDIADKNERLLRSQSEEFRQQLDAGTYASRTFNEYSLIISTLSLLASSFIFAKLWCKAHPGHLRTTREDIEAVRRPYLLVVSTTMFIPNCIGALVFLGIDIASRFDSSVIAVSASLLTFLGLLPFLVCAILGSYRINQVLMQRESWRIGKTLFLFFIANALTNIVIGGVLALAAVVIVSQ